MRIRNAIGATAALVAGLVGPAGAEVTDVHVSAAIDAEAFARNDDLGLVFDRRPREEVSDFTSFQRELTAAADGELVDGEVRIAHGTTVSVGTDTLLFRSIVTAEEAGERKRVLSGDELIIAEGGGRAFTNLSLSFTVTERSSFALSAVVEVQGDPPGGDEEDGGQNNASFSFGLGKPIPSIRAGDGRGDPRSGSIAETGILEPGSYSLGGALSVFRPGGLVVPVSSGTWRVTLSVTPDETGDEFVWVGGASGAFGDPGNWNPPQVPTFVDGDRNDLAIFESGPNPTVDFGVVALGSARGANPPRQLGAMRVNHNRRVVLDAPVVTLKSRAPTRPALDVSTGGELTIQGLTVLESPSTSLGNRVLGGGGGKATFTIGAEGIFECPGPLVVGEEAELRIFDGFASCTGGFLSAVEGIAEVRGTSGHWITGQLALGVLSGRGALSVTDGLLETLEADLFGDGVSVTVSGASRSAPGTWNAGDLDVFGGLVEVLEGGLVHAAGVELGGSSVGVTKMELLAGKLEVDTDLFLKGSGAGQLPGNLRVADRGGLDVGGRIEIQGGTLSIDGPPFAPGEGPSAVDVLVRGGSLRLAAGGELTALGNATVGVGVAGIAEVGLPANAAVPSEWTVFGSLGVGGDTVFETGILRLANGVVDVGTMTIGRFGTVSGIGTLRGSTVAGGDGTIRNHGILRAGISIDGNLVNAPEGLVELPPSGAQSAPLLNPLAASLPRVVRRARPVTPPPSSPVGVTGDATLGGTLVLQFRNGFAPGQGDSFEVLDVAGSVTGDFAAIEVRGLAPGAEFEAALSDGGYTVTSLTDAVALPPISLKAKARVKEKKKGGLKLKLKRGGDTAQALLVSYALRGTARNGFDYEQLPGIVEIPAGKLTAAIPLVPLGDSLAEGAETVELELLSGDGYSLPLDADVSIEIVDAKTKKK